EHGGKGAIRRDKNCIDSKALQLGFAVVPRRQDVLVRGDELVAVEVAAAVHKNSLGRVKAVNQVTAPLICRKHTEPTKRIERGYFLNGELLWIKLSRKTGPPGRKRTGHEQHRRNRNQVPAF